MVVREYTQATETYPNNADVRFALGQIHQQSGYFDQALDAYQYAIRDSSFEVMARLSSAHCYWLKASLKQQFNSLNKRYNSFAVVNAVRLILLNGRRVRAKKVRST